MKTFLLLLAGVTSIALAPRAQAQGAGGEQVTLTGILQGGLLAVGGESTGWALNYRDDTGPHSIEVALPRELMARARSGATVRLTGTIVMREYVERGTVRILQVSRLDDAGTPAAAPQPVPPAAATQPVPAPRLPQLTLEQLNPQQRALAEEILKVSSIGLGGPYNSMLRSPEMGERLFKLLDYLRFNTSVPRRLNEFAILVQARLWTSQVAWLAHYPLAIKEGISEDTAAALRDGRRPLAMKADEAVVYDLSMEIATTRRLSDTTYRRAKDIFTDQQIVDLVTVSGTYATLAMLMNTAAQGLPPGTVPPLPPMFGR